MALEEVSIKGVSVSVDRAGNMKFDIDAVLGGKIEIYEDDLGQLKSKKAAPTLSDIAIWATCKHDLLTGGKHRGLLVRL